MSNQNPVFVIGVFRSGTSLLCSLLNQNPKIALMYECDVWNFPRPLLPLRFRHNWAERIEFYNQALSRHRMIEEHDCRGLDQIRTPLDLYRTFGERKGAAVSGEKSPFYCDRLEQLHKRYPDAYFIIVWRPPGEIYRSVVKAGQTSRFFGKPGMLSRLIYQQEQLIQQASRIEKSGARILRVGYASVVDQTEKICRDVSGFLGVPFDSQMLHLNKADLSAIYKAPHHAYLRRGIIERQHYTQELISPAITKKLERYRHRWEQMQADWLKIPDNPMQPKPGFIESAFHTVAGKLWTYYDSLVRAGFEFLPLQWLRVYRVLKIWVINPPSGVTDEKTSLLKDLKLHWQTLLLAGLLFAAIAEVHSRANPHLMFLLFYALPCGIIALLVNARWATLFVLAAAFMGPTIQFEGDSEYRTTLVFVWNFIGRFILLEVFTLTLGRIRQECVH